jgi:hypothetical protein
MMDVLLRGRELERIDFLKYESGYSYTACYVGGLVERISLYAFNFRAY